mgnify:CR=1 FL=1
MKSRWISLIVFLSFTTLLVSLAPKSLPNLQGSSAWGDEDTLPFPKDATFTTLTTTPRAIEELTGDNHRNLYTGGSGAPPARLANQHQIPTCSYSGRIRRANTAAATWLKRLRLHWHCVG